MASRAPKPPSGGVSNATPPPGARKVVRRRSGGKHFERTIREPTREELHRGPSREELPKEVQEMSKRAQERPRGHFSIYFFCVFVSNVFEQALSEYFE